MLDGGPGLPQPHTKGAILKQKSGWPNTCPDMSGDRYIQSDLAGGSTGTVRMPIGVYRVLDRLHIGATWRIRFNRPHAVAMRSYVIYYD